MVKTGYFDKYGMDVTLKSKTETVVDNIYGINEITYTETVIKAIINSVSEDKVLKEYGIEITGETKRYENINAIAFVKGNIIVNEGDQIVSDKTYEIVKIKEAYFKGSLVYKELWLREI